MGKKANIAIIVVVIVFLVVYGFIIYDMYARSWGLFAPYDPPPPDPENSFRPGGMPIILEESEIEERQSIINDNDSECENINTTD